MVQGLLPVNAAAQPADALPNGGSASPPSASTPPPSLPPTTGTLLPNPSFISSSAVVYSMDCGVAVRGVPSAPKSSSASPVTVDGNVFYESYDVSTVDIQTSGNTITNNLALGTIKEMASVSSQNLQVRREWCGNV